MQYIDTQKQRNVLFFFEKFKKSKEKKYFFKGKIQKSKEKF
jgi:hypothetical protein